MTTARVIIGAQLGLDGQGTVIATLSGTEPWRPRILARGRAADAGWARVALVQSRASLLAGDDVSLQVTVGPGARLELVELGAMVVHDGRGGASGRLRVTASVGEGGRLVWLGQPLIVAAGASASSDLLVSLATDAVALRGESLVLGRTGEACGALRAHSRFVQDGRPLLDETLDTGGPALRSAVVAGAATMIAAVTLAGARDGTPPPGATQGHGPATVWRAAGEAVEIAARTAVVAERWHALLATANPELSDGAPSSPSRTADAPEVRAAASRPPRQPALQR